MFFVMIYRILLYTASYVFAYCLSFPLVGNLYSKKDAGQAGMTDSTRTRNYAQLFIIYDSNIIF